MAPFNFSAFLKMKIIQEFDTTSQLYNASHQPMLVLRLNVHLFVIDGMVHERINRTLTIYSLFADILREQIIFMCNVF